MPSFDVAYIPDDLWKKFESGEIHHFAYDLQKNNATAHFADGRESVAFSTLVTSEMREAERQERRRKALERGAIIFTYESRVSVSLDTGKGMIVNAGC